MVHLAGLLPVIGALEGKKAPASKRADGLPMHAGMDETNLLTSLVEPSRFCRTFLRLTTFEERITWWVERAMRREAMRWELTSDA